MVPGGREEWDDFPSVPRRGSFDSRLDGWRWELHRFRLRDLTPDVTSFADFVALYVIVHGLYHHPSKTRTLGNVGGLPRTVELGFDYLEEIAETHRTSVRLPTTARQAAEAAGATGRRPPLRSRPIVWADLPDLCGNRTSCLTMWATRSHQPDPDHTYNIAGLPPKDQKIEHFLLLPGCKDRTFLIESDGSFYVHRYRHIIVPGDYQLRRS